MQYILIAAEESPGLLDTWMLSHPKIGDMWYDKFSKDENFLQHLNQASEKITNAECLVMNKISESHPKFSLKVGDCNDKHAVVCRVEPQRIIDLTESPKFPCLNPNQVLRRKRSPEDKGGPERQEGIGVFFQMLNTELEIIECDRNM